MLVEAFEVGRLPPSLNQAIITLILKKDKDPTECKSYRPISLISVDCRLLSKILANRLDNILGSVIHSDQVGFIRKRNSSNNVRRLINIMWYVRDSNDPTAAISLDAEKAFDRIGTCFIHSELLGLDKHLRWIEILYKDPEAAVQTNGLISSYFTLSRGTRQGSALSPGLFCLALKPLAVAIRKNPYIQLFCLRHIAQWMLSPERAPSWFKMEYNMFSPLAPINALSCRLSSKLQSHPIIANLYNVWKKISQMFHLNVHLNSESCIWNNPKLKIAGHSFVWRNWLEKGITTLADLYEGKKVKTFESGS